MKKVFVFFAMATMTIAIVKAEGVKNVEKNVNSSENSFVVEEVQQNTDSVIYKFNLHLRDMNKSMHLDYDQIEELRLTNGELTRRIAQLEKVPAGDRQAKLTRILAENLAYVRILVDDAQYRVYLSLLNEEFNKTGLNAILFGYNQLAVK